MWCKIQVLSPLIQTWHIIMSHIKEQIQSHSVNFNTHMKSNLIEMLSKCCRMYWVLSKKLIWKYFIWWCKIWVLHHILIKFGLKEKKKKKKKKKPQNLLSRLFFTRYYTLRSTTNTLKKSIKNQNWLREYVIFKTDWESTSSSTITLIILHR